MKLTAGALLLDMDGTLLNSDAAVDRVWRRWAAENGEDAEAILPHCHGRQAHATLAALFPDRDPAKNLEDNARMLEWEVEDTEGIVPIPGAPAFMSALADGELPHALVTSANRALSDARMGAAGLPMPVTRITAESVQKSKPDPEGFLLGATGLKIEPADCVVFEDSPAGVAAGRAAGMRVVGVGPRAAGELPDVHVDDLDQIKITELPDGRIQLEFTG
ncbi:HAD-IA family hydrolase [Streptomyces sp. A7024]|uniref:HAD-IA family hydrolase n=1 Tax=Streptomyces coryli TaxID=1128680 RepID=A0A6G4UCL0_9ACTN|nr:HAD-IA family hydrolase [Streptomyces coryli]NGN69883.1 HAD-IA family hydrolase [Streptomyces coryli]